MSVQPVSFGARVKGNPRALLNPAEIEQGIFNSLTPSDIISTIGSSASCTSASCAGSTVSEVSGSAVDVMATAFGLKSLGINSSGIVPSSINMVESTATPATVASSVEHPGFVATVLSTVGGWFSPFFSSTKKEVKMPSRR